MDIYNATPSVITKAETHYGEKAVAESDKPRLQQEAVSTVVKPHSGLNVTEKFDLDVVNQVNFELAKIEQGLAFSYDESTNLSVIKLIDKSTDEVIKQFPSEDAMRVIRNIQSYLSDLGQSPDKNNKGLTGAIFNEII